MLLRSTRSCAPLALLAPLAPLALRLREDIAAHHTHTHYLRDLEPLVQAIVGNDQQAVEQVIGTMSQLPNATLQELLANPAQLRAVVTQRPAAGVPSSGAAVALDFSPDSRRCVTIGQGPMYTMAVWANTHADGAWTSCDLQVRGGRGGHAIVIIIQVCYHGTCNGYL